MYIQLIFDLPDEGIVSNIQQLVYIEYRKNLLYCTCSVAGPFLTMM